MQLIAREVRQVKNMSKQLTNIARAVIMVFAMIHLIFTNIHAAALLLLENEICGFIMFLFVLTGLVALFETTRIRPRKKRERLLTALASFAAAGLGGCLVSIYKNAVAVQRSLDIAVVNKAALFSMAIIAAYVIAGGLLLLDLAINK